jgi:hypothetical protein
MASETTVDINDQFFLVQRAYKEARRRILEQFNLELIAPKDLNDSSIVDNRGMAWKVVDSEVENVHSNTITIAGIKHTGTKSRVFRETQHSMVMTNLGFGHLKIHILTTDMEEKDG